MDPEIKQAPSNNEEKTEVDWGWLPPELRMIIGSMMLKDHEVMHFLRKKIFEGMCRPMLRGHKGAIWSADFNRGQDKAVTVGGDNTAKVWACDNGAWNCEATLGGGVCLAVFNSAGTKIVTASNDGAAKIWAFKKEEGWVVEARLLLDNKITPIEVTGIYRVFEDWRNNRVTAAVFNCHGDRVAMATAEGTIQVLVWANDVWREEAKFKCGRVRSAEFSRAGDKLIAVSQARTIKVWAFINGAWLCEATLEGHEDRVNAAVFNRSGNKIVTASKDGTAKIWAFDNENGWIEEVTLRGHRTSVMSAVFNGHEDRVLTASEDLTAKVWLCDNGAWSCEATLEHIAAVTSARFNSHEDKIVTFFGLGRAKIWTFDNDAWRCVATLGKENEEAFKDKDFTSCEDKIVTVFENREVRILDLGRFFKIVKFLKERIRLKQALLLVCIFQAMVDGSRFDFNSCRTHFDELHEEIKRHFDAFVIRHLISEEDIK